MDKFDLECVDNIDTYSIRWILEEREQAWKDRINEWRRLREAQKFSCKECPFSKY